MPDYQVLTALTAAAERLGKPEGWGGAVQGLLYGQHSPAGCRSPMSWSRNGRRGSGWVCWPAKWSRRPCLPWPPPRVRCGSVFHVIWNQEREKAGLDQKESHDTSAAIQVGVEAVKLLIRQDRERA